MSPSEADAPQPRDTGGLDASPADDQEVEIDLDACELDALELFLESNDSELARFADGCPRRIPPKARRSCERLTWALLERWAWPECRAYLAERMAATDIRVELQLRGLDVLPEVAGVFPSNALLWWAHEAGLDPRAVLASLDEEARRLFALRQPILQLLAERLREWREARYAAADEAQVQAARAAASTSTPASRPARGWRRP